MSSQNGNALPSIYQRRRLIRFAGSLSPTEKHILLTIDDHINKASGKATVSQQTLAWEMSAGLRTVVRLLQGLGSRKIIEVTCPNRRATRQTSIDWGQLAQLERPPRYDEDRPAQDDAETRHHDGSERLRSAVEDVPRPDTVSGLNAETCHDGTSETCHHDNSHARRATMAPLRHAILYAETCHDGTETALEQNSNSKTKNPPYPPNAAEADSNHLDAAAASHPTKAAPKRKHASTDAAAEAAIPSDIDPGVADALKCWIHHRREIKKPATKTAVKMQAKQLRTLHPREAIDRIEHSIAQGWQGIFPHDSTHKANGQPRSQPGALYDPNPKEGDGVW